MLAGAVCGSVAHGAAAEHSDVEVIAVVDASVEEGDEYFFDQGVMVECAVARSERLLASARSVPWNWGVKADAYRHQIVIWDPSFFFEQLRAAATTIPDEDFERALEETWWIVFEERGKLQNALAAADIPRAVYTGWEFAYAAAMRIALRQRRPYESGRTLWSDAASRGYRMEPLIEALPRGDLAEITRCVDEVWRTIGDWDVPSGAPPA